MTGHLNIFLILSMFLFATGAFGVLIRRNALLILMSIELMLNAVNLAFITFARGFGGVAALAGGEVDLAQSMQGHIFVLMIMAVAAAEAAVGIAIVVTLYRSRGQIVVDETRELKG